MNWIELEQKYINLDNIAFIAKGEKVLGFDSEETYKAKIGFIGGQYLDLEVMSYELVKQTIEKHLGNIKHNLQTYRVYKHAVQT